MAQSWQPGTLVDSSVLLDEKGHAVAQVSRGLLGWTATVAGTSRPGFATEAAAKRYARTRLRQLPKKVR